MDEGTLKKLFEPFFTTKPVGEGTGLGLSISYNTIKKHNGTIAVKSELDRGTEFRINIPIIQINP
jgi:two-component system, NtrC family, sensor kinase